MTDEKDVFYVSIGPPLADENWHEWRCEQNVFGFSNERGCELCGQKPQSGDIVFFRQRGLARDYSRCQQCFLAMLTHSRISEIFERGKR